MSVCLSVGNLENAGYNMMIAVQNSKYDQVVEHTRLRQAPVEKVLPH